MEYREYQLLSIVKRISEFNGQKNRPEFIVKGKEGKVIAVE